LELSEQIVMQCTHGQLKRIEVENKRIPRGATSSKFPFSMSNFI